MQLPRIIAGGVLALMGIGIFLISQSSERKPVLKTRAMKNTEKSVPLLENQTRTATPHSAEPMTDHEVKELEVLLSDESLPQVEETLIIDGVPLIRVLGDKVTKDPVTGVLTITGVTKLLLIDGSHVEMSPDGYVTHDPATGKTHADAAHTKFVPAKKPDEK